MGSTEGQSPAVGGARGVPPPTPSHGRRREPRPARSPRPHYPGLGRRSRRRIQQQDHRPLPLHPDGAAAAPTRGLRSIDHHNPPPRDSVSRAPAPAFILAASSPRGAQLPLPP